MRTHEKLGFDDIEMSEYLSESYTPKNINKELTREFFLDIPESVKIYAREIFKVNGWKFYVTAQRKGYCNHRAKIITVPTFAITRGISYKTWYVSHELAHAYAGYKAKHGPIFMDWLKRICPMNDIYHELGYKPRNAKAAGIDLLDL